MNQQFKATPPELADRAIYHGMFSQLARELSVTPQHVRQVAYGISTSKRVWIAVQREVQRRKRSRNKAAA